MKKMLVIAAFLAVCILPVAAQYKVTGNVTGIEDGTTAYLTLVGREHVNIDSTTVQRGHFEFRGGNMPEPRWALIKLKGSFVPTCDFYLENGNITITGERYGAKATGTPTNAVYEDYNTEVAPMNDSLYALNINVGMEKDSVRHDSLKSELKKQERLLIQKELSFIRNHPGSPVSLRIAEQMPVKLTSAETLSMISLLSEELQQKEKIQQIKARAEQLAKAEAGSEAPGFTLPNAQGEQISLSSQLGKYVLIDFWASWCAPCRASFPAVADLNTRYAGKLTVVGVSLDRSESAWRKAMAEEKCTWVQLLDQKGVAAKAYAVSGIPLLVLVSPEGRIIGRFNIVDITEELKRLLGE